MSKLPALSGQEPCEVLEKVGYRVNHQSGGHVILRNEAPPHRQLTVPKHKEIAKGTL